MSVNESAVRVGHGPRTDFIGLAALVLFATAVASALLGFLAGYPWAQVLPTMGLLMVPVLGLAVVVYVLGTAREIELSSSGIEVRRRIGSKFVRWDWLRPPPKGQLVLGSITFAYIEPAQRSQAPKGFSVSVRQARAILEHACCPRWPETASLRKRIGGSSS